MEFLGIIILIILIVLLIKFVKFLFTNYIISRIICAIMGIAAIISSFAAGKTFIVPVILTALSWLFFIGPTVFHVEWDGTWNISSTSSGWKATPNMTGGFISNAVIALVVAFAVPLIFGADPLTLAILPAIVLLLDAISFLNMFRK